MAYKKTYWFCCNVISQSEHVIITLTVLIVIENVKLIGNFVHGMHTYIA